MADTPSPITYLQIARALPCPTQEQRARFLQRLAGMRAWLSLLPLAGGIPLTLLLNPRAGDDRLDYASPLARGATVLATGEPGLPRDASYCILDEAGRAVPLPADLLGRATCQLNAMVSPDVAALLETLPLRLPAPPQVADAGARLAPIGDDAQLRDFAERYVAEDLAGFQCPDDRAAWEQRQFAAFQQLYAPRHAAQLAALRRALDGLLAEIFRA